MPTGKGTNLESAAALDVFLALDAGTTPTLANPCATDDVTGIGNVLGAIALTAAETHDSSQGFAAGDTGSDEERIFDPR